jgi:hypothetical protein
MTAENPAERPAEKATLRSRVLPPGVRRVLRPFARAVRGFRGIETPPPDPFRRHRDPAGPRIVAYPAMRQVPPVGGPGRVTLLMPGLEMARMTGGPNTALNLAARLREHGYPLRFAATLASLDEDPARVAAHIERLAGPDNGEIELVEVSRTAPLEVAPDDLFVATSWPTAHISERARRLTDAPAFVYLIQDYEPGFYPFSTSYAMAAATYRMPIRAVFNERLLLDHFVHERIGRFGDADAAASGQWTSFEPAVDRSLFRHEPHPSERRRRALFYARPRNERNCFDLGLRALRQAVDEGAFPVDGWDILSIGADVPELELGRGQVLRPAGWMTYPDYARFIAGSDVMLSLMLSPHTSYPPLEMAATGGRVVTNIFSVKTAEALRSISSYIDAVEPDPDELAGALVRAGRAASGEAPAWDGEFALPSSWDDAFAETVPWLVRTLAEIRTGQ